MTPDTKERLERIERDILTLKAQVDLLIRLAGGNAGGGAAPVTAAPETASNDHSVDCLMLFTPKQHAVMQMICAGMGTDEMAEMLAVTPSTIKVHIRGVMRKASLRTRAQIVMHYRDIVEHQDEKDYRRFAGIPKDWAERPGEYPKETEMLRVKSRG